MILKTDVTLTGKTLGDGSGGSVIEGIYNKNKVAIKVAVKVISTKKHDIDSIKNEIDVSWSEFSTTDS